MNQRVLGKLTDLLEEADKIDDLLQRGHPIADQLKQVMVNNRTEVNTLIRQLSGINKQLEYYK